MHLFSCFSLFWINNQILSLNNSSTLFSFALFNFNFNYVVIYWVRLGFYLVFSFLLFYLDNVSEKHSFKKNEQFSVLFGYRSKFCRSTAEHCISKVLFYETSKSISMKFIALDDRIEKSSNIFVLENNF